MPHGSPRDRGDPFLDIVSHGRGVPSKRHQLRAAQIEQFARTVRHTPEVMVKISGGGQSTKAVAAHFKYIGRQEFEVETDDGERLNGKGGAGELESWTLKLRSYDRPIAACQAASRPSWYTTLCYRCLRAQGIAANATERAVRGATNPLKSDGIYWAMRADGREGLANEVERFIAGMPPSRTEREWMALAMSERTRDLGRLQPTAATR